MKIIIDIREFSKQELAALLEEIYSKGIVWVGIHATTFMPPRRAAFLVVDPEAKDVSWTDCWFSSYEKYQKVVPSFDTKAALDLTPKEIIAYGRTYVLKEE